MYELIRLTDRDYYIDCPAKIGLVRLNDTDVIAIDSGNDKDAAKKVLRHVDENGWKLTAVYNTHSHADHIGGNRLLQERTGCPVYAADMEAVYTANPILEPMTLYGGYPFGDLKHKFLLAQDSRVTPLTADCLPQGMEMIPLPGHSFAMVGFRTPDDTVYLGDCISSEETLTKYGIGYLWDVAAALDTLDRVESMTAARFVPAHAPVCTDIAAPAQRNRDAIRQVAETIVNLCRTPIPFEGLLAKLFAAYGMTMNAAQYALIGSTVRSYLAYLHGQGALTFTFEDNRMLWATAQ